MSFDHFILQLHLHRINVVVIVSLAVNDLLQACAKFDDDGQCKEHCPPLTIYNEVTFNQEPNPDAKYKYGTLCVDQCPCKYVLYCMTFSVHNTS